VFRWHDPTIAVRKVEAVAGVGNQNYVPTHVRSRADGRRHAHVGRYSERHDVLGAEPLQSKIEISADEGGIHALRNEWLAFEWLKPWTKCVSGRSRRERRAGLNRV